MLPPHPDGPPLKQMAHLPAVVHLNLLARWLARDGLTLIISDQSEGNRPVCRFIPDDQAVQ